ncbi:hypothetical protein ACEWY4_016888 [Coilia grayii]|uniref:Integrase catalytic domain-containing protein n=1 Tax=Coilia grayii TaxID=363190 RepID=A0ABD1JN32_9TELE
MDNTKIKAVLDWPAPSYKDPDLPFIVEVDASEVGVGAVLSQRFPHDQKMPPCAFFSHWLTLAESRYNVEDRELLAVKLVLEEWRHWLEEARHPLMVWTDHKNLEYVCQARRLKEDRLKEIVRYHGTPEEILSDRGPQFISRFWRAFWQLMGVTVHLTSGYHPQTNGQTERVNQEMEKYLRSYCSSKPTTWASYLIWAELAHNQLISSSLGMSPFEALTGYPLALFPASSTDSPVPSANSLVQHPRGLGRKVRQNLPQASSHHKRQADRRRWVAVFYAPGDRVWVSTKGLAIPVESKKLAPSKPSFPVSSPLSPALRTPPPPRIVEGAPAYKVKRLLAVCQRGQGLEFLAAMDRKNVLGYPEGISWTPL